jgi:hypothetical protein
MAINIDRLEKLLMDFGVVEKITWSRQHNTLEIKITDHFSNDMKSITGCHNYILGAIPTPRIAIVKYSKIKKDLFHLIIEL